MIRFFLVLLIVIHFISCSSKPTESEVKESFIERAKNKIDLKIFEIKNSYKSIQDGVENYEYYVTARYILLDSNSLGFYGDEYLLDSTNISFIKTDKGWRMTSLGLELGRGKKIKWGASTFFENRVYKGKIDVYGTGERNVLLNVSCNSGIVHGTIIIDEKEIIVNGGLTYYYGYELRTEFTSVLLIYNNVL
jgi:hypothetical protein